MKKYFITVLMYHALENEPYDSGYTKSGDRLYVLSTKAFREQMGYLFSEGYKTYLLNEISRINELPERIVIITFDDGHASNYKIAFPILKEFGFKAEFFITTNYIDTDCFMSEEQIKFIHRSGMSIGSHGVSHRFLPDLEPASVKCELSESKRILEKITGESVFYFSAPGGRLSSLGTSLAKQCGYKLICTSESKLASLKEDAFLIPRYAIKADTSFKYFKELVNHQEKWYRIGSSKQKILNLCKAMLGSYTYEYLRETILSCFYREKVRSDAKN